MFSVDIAILGTNDYRTVTQQVMDWLFPVAEKQGRAFVESFHAEYSRDTNGAGGLVRCTATLSSTSELIKHEMELRSELDRTLKQSSPTSTIACFELLETARSLEPSFNEAGYAQIDDDILEISDF